jgi:hypothetical protein
VQIGAIDEQRNLASSIFHGVSEQKQQYPRGRAIFDASKRPRRERPFPLECTAIEEASPERPAARDRSRTTGLFLRPGRGPQPSDARSPEGTTIGARVPSAQAISSVFHSMSGRVNIELEKTLERRAGEALNWLNI